MKKLLLYLPLLSIAAIAVSSCKHGKSWFGATMSDTLCVDTFKYAKIDSTDGRTIDVSVEADYPSPITGELSANVASWIRKGIGKETATPDTMDGQKVVDFLGSQIFDGYKAENEFLSDMAYSASAKIVCMRRQYVSYVLTVYEYTGGAHGMTSVEGATFSQTDGKQYGWELLKDTAKTGFHKLLKKGIRKYFSTDVSKGEITDEELANMLLLNPDGSPATQEQLDHFPVPAAAPYLTRKGVTFVYGAYEIAPYAAGMPTFTVDFDDIKDYLSHEGKRLLKKRE